MPSRKLARDLEHVLEQARRRIGDVRLDVPELEAIAPPEPGRAQGEAARARRPWRRSDLILIALTAAMAVWGAALWTGWGFPALRHSEPLPMTAAAGLVLQGSTLQALDPTRQLLFTLGPDGEVLGMARFDQPDVAGLALGDGGYWASGLGGRVVFHSSDSGFPIKRTYLHPGRIPGALAWDGALLWVSDPVTENIYEYAAENDLVPVRALPLAGSKPVALHRQGQMLWVLDGPSRILRRYHVGPLPTPVDETPLGDLLEPQMKPVGMAVGPGTLWVLTQQPVMLHRFTISRLRWRVAPRPFGP